MWPQQSKQDWKNVTFESKFYEIHRGYINTAEIKYEKNSSINFFLYQETYTKTSHVLHLFKKNIILMPKVYKKTRATDSVQTNIVIK